MADVNEQVRLGEYVFGLLEKGQTRADIEADLVNKGHDERFVKELIQETSKLRDAQRRSQGLTLILIGAAVCFTSFLLTITTSSIQGNFSVVLYGLTSLGILFAFAGFMKVF